MCLTKAPRRKGRARTGDLIPLTTLGTVINLNPPGRYLHWSIFTVSVANLVLIAVMVLIFGAALLIPFPRGRAGDTGEPVDSAEPTDAAPRGDPRSPETDADANMWTARIRRRALGLTAARQAAPGPPARLRRVMGLRLRGRHPGGARHRDRLGLRDRARRPGLVAHQPGRPLLQQPAPLERRAVHGLHGHPPVGQVLDGRLARPAAPHLDHRRGRLRRVGRRVLHRVSVPAELRLPVDLDERQGRHQRGRRRRVLQPHELRPDAALARRADPDRARRARRRPRPARPGPRGVPSAPGPPGRGPSGTASGRGGRRRRVARPALGATTS